MILAMILFTLAIGVAVWSITVVSTTKESVWSLFLIFSVFCIMTGVAVMVSIPTNKDVREGEAHYIEQNHIEIVNGDTVNNYKTYEIIWNQN
jgi:hypothetical protein